MDSDFLVQTMKLLLAGVPLTLKLAFYSIAAGAVFAVLLALMRLSGNRVLDSAARSYPR